MNEKRNIELAPDPDSAETRTRSDVAPKQKAESGSPARHISGLRPAVHIPGPPGSPSRVPTVPPAPLTPEDLLEDGWDDEEDDDDSGPTLLDQQGVVPRDLVAETRRRSDPIGEAPEPETHEVRTHEVRTREISPTFDRDEAPTGEMPTVQNTLPADSDDEDDDREFSHDDFPTRQTPMGLQQALLGFPPPSDSHRGLHETLPTPADDSTPDLPSTPSGSMEAPISSPSFPEVSPPARISPLSAAPISPLSPRASSLVSPPPMSPDETAQMPNAPAHPRLDELLQMPPPSERSSVSQISQVSHPSYPSQASHASRALVYPTPTSISGAPLLPANTVRFAFLRNLSPNSDPPLGRLVVVAAIAFFATLVLSAFIAWVIVLVRH